MEILHDKDIREPLFEFLEDKYGKIRILEEKTMGKSRADAVMITPTDIFGIEIKSDADTYVRLASQVKDYDKYFDFNYVVVGTSHGEHIEEHVPKYWGIITVEQIGSEQNGSAFDFYVLRMPAPNPKVKWKRKIEILWRPELALIQELNNMPKYKAESKDFVRCKILERLEKGKIEEKTLKEQFSNILFERDYNAITSILIEYKKAELTRKIEKENDPLKKLELEAQRERAEKNFGRKRKKYRRR